MLDVEDRHPAVAEFADLFEVAHLPEGLPRHVMNGYRTAAQALLDLLPDGPMLTRSLHDLWRSKNEAIAYAVRIHRQDGI